MEDPDDYGWLRVRVDEEQPLTFDDHPMNSYRKIIVVEHADPVVSASVELLHQAQKWGHITGDGDTLRVGTDGHGLGVVEYRISEHPAGPKYRVLTKVGTDRDR